ncbi:MAG: hypothetical protein M1838_002041 [Thelocarpon superellum]|nr:MAG: hypothetical protein M1838_002041 [Thelocarpon superellum]
MCIALITTQHPEYSLILLNNRDEFLDRPTAPASWWPSPNHEVLGGRDLMRAEHGTWLGVTRQGRIAVLTNFREKDETSAHAAGGTRSRGGMVNAWLQLAPASTETTSMFVERLCNDAAGLKGVGGFSLVCGQLGRDADGKPRPLAVLSNRTPDAQAATWITAASAQVYGLSNSAYDDPWPKVEMGKKLVTEAIAASVESAEDQAHLIQRLFDVLNTNTLPRRKTGDTFETYLAQLRHSIFVPAITTAVPAATARQDRASAPANARVEMLERADTERAADTSPIYGTQKQTIVLVDHHQHVTFIERTLFDQDVAPIPVGQGDRRFDFTVQGTR